MSRSVGRSVGRLVLVSFYLNMEFQVVFQKGARGGLVDISIGASNRTASSLLRVHLFEFLHRDDPRLSICIRAILA